MKITLKKNEPEKTKQFFADKLAFTTGPVELSHALKESADFAVIDVRDAEDYQNGHIPRAINLPRDKWSSLAGLRKDALNVLYCYTQQCHLAATAAFEFAGKGYSVMEMEGGFQAWKDNNLEIENGRSEPTGKRQISVTA